MSSVSKVGFIKSAVRPLPIYQPKFYLDEKAMSQIVDQPEDPIEWENHRAFLDDEDATHMKPSRQRFIRQKTIKKFKWNHFVYDFCKNYEAIREEAREKSRGTKTLARIENSHSWLGER
ncbi:hypothetical protein DICPUDRAFT_40224 [Dictyostelium purpureum]|uniref:Uncharacterized protein n=1 Tax=Dictyostelium purpureum TaxID=5786 RepID=F0ZXU9_DICPU|nr:uncharacterized protein DICPUDRAFT_40224 [Dictyostelium purpureum]EGC31236.1 hypothetical protein DICPUDRAFT_40224 [Dictyostelium purpureum]|eukprot:XP_003292239.1 hypothetical protein DICPUDRAFT_40224 [Dictyostelium purpureum]